MVFVACAIRAYLLAKLSSYLKDNSTSLKKVFSQLSNVTVFSGREGYRFAKVLTKKQKQILGAFYVADEIMATLND